MSSYPILWHKSNVNKTVLKRSYYITTAIPYVNAKPHIGFALELVQSDVLARYQRIAGSDTYFLSGVDENSLKNVRAAEAASLTTQQLCDQNSAVFQELIQQLHISTDQFVRTSGCPNAMVGLSPRRYLYPNLRGPVLRGL